jgi:hypothetical protein
VLLFTLSFLSQWSLLGCLKTIVLNWEWRPLDFEDLVVAEFYYYSLFHIKYKSKMHWGKGSSPSSESPGYNAVGASAPLNKGVVRFDHGFWNFYKNMPEYDKLLGNTLFHLLHVVDSEKLNLEKSKELDCSSVSAPTESRFTDKA